MTSGRRCTAYASRRVVAGAIGQSVERAGRRHDSIVVSHDQIGEKVDRRPWAMARIKRDCMVSDVDVEKQR